MSAQTTLLSYIQIANALLCLLLAAQFLVLPAKHQIPKRLLGINFLLYAHQSLALAFILTGHAGAFNFTRPALAMLLGPALYVYFVSVQRREAQWQWRDMWHYVVGILVFTVLFIVKPLRDFLEFAIVASFTIYSLWIIYRIRHLHGEQARLAHLGIHSQSAYNWLLCLVGVALLNIALEIAVAFELAQGVSLRNSFSLFVGGLVFLMVNFLTILGALLRSDLIEWMYRVGDQTLHRNVPKIDTQEAQTLFQRWEDLVKTERLHTQEFGITLPQAARKLQVPARQLSNAINQIYGKSFSIYLNDQRIFETQRLLLENPDKTIIEVMQESGFSSKSNFNKEFLRVTGVSPSAFRDGCLGLVAGQ